MFTTIFIFIGLLLVLVLIHEWGHFFAARKLGIMVEEFGFGFPPRAWSFVKRGVCYSFNWLPLGGFVKLKGENGDDRNDPDSFAAQLPWRRVVVLVAGVGMNLILAFSLLTIGFMAGFPTAIDDSMLAQARDIKVQITSVMLDSPAAQAGLEPGDVLVSINGVRYYRVTEVQSAILNTNGKVTIELWRGDNILTKILQPAVLKGVSDKPVIGVGLAQMGVISYPWYKAIGVGVTATVRLTGEIFKGFGRLLSNLVIRQEVPRDLAGPVGIAIMTGQVVDMGWMYLLQFAALLSLNLAVLNILPFPALDGGRLLFVIIEKIRRRALSLKAEAIVHQLGFMFLITLVVLITYRDVLRLFSS